MEDKTWMSRRNKCMNGNAMTQHEGIQSKTAESEREGQRVAATANCTWAKNNSIWFFRWHCTRCHKQSIQYIVPMKRTHQMRLLASSQRKLRAKHSKAKLKHQTIETINIRPQAYAIRCHDHIDCVCARSRWYTHCNEGENETRRGKEPPAALKYTQTHMCTRHNGVCASEWQHHTLTVLFVLSHRFDKRSHQLDSIEHEQCHFRLHTEKAGSIPAIAAAAVDGEQWREKLNNWTKMEN